MKWFFRVTAMVLVTLMLAAGFAGCNTMRGMGKDLERGGQKLQGR